MNSQEVLMHMRAGREYGKESTCGQKNQYHSEELANKLAAKMTAKHKGEKLLEAYPCYWCLLWHIGRAMTEEEQNTFKGQ